MQFGYHVVTAHHDGGSVVTKREVPIFIHFVNDALDVLIEISSVENQPQSDTTLCGVFKCTHNRVFTPAIGPIHVQVLQGKENFFLRTIEHFYHGIDAIVRAYQEGCFIIACEARRRVSKYRTRCGECPPCRCISSGNCSNVAAGIVLVKSEM